MLLDEPLSNLDANLREEMRFEVRRLHDAYRYTTVYVTHDQSEAMTTADLIAVMNAGKIEQAGSPEDIYDRPRSEFVARFIGSSNVIKGKGLDAARISISRAHRCAVWGRKSSPGLRSRSRSVRMISQYPRRNGRAKTSCRRPWCGRSFSAAAGTIWLKPRTARSCAYLPPRARVFPQGSTVWLTCRRERCRALSGQ